MREHRIAAIPADGIGPEVISAGLEVLDAVAGVGVLCLGVDGLQGTRLPEFDIIPHVQLQALKNLQAPHRQICFQVGHVPPTRRADGASIHARGCTGDISPLEQRHVVAVLCQMVGC